MIILLNQWSFHLKLQQKSLFAEQHSQNSNGKEPRNWDRVSKRVDMSRVRSLELKDNKNHQRGWQVPNPYTRRRSVLMLGKNQSIHGLSKKISCIGGEQGADIGWL